MLLLHGFGDTPQTLHYVATSLHEAGFTVRAPLLPGHGRSIVDFARSRGTDWVAHARSEYAGLRSSFPTVGIAGLSMGGAIAAILASETHDLPALVLLAPYVGMPRALAAAALSHRAWGPMAGPFKASSPKSIRDPEERAKNLAYGATTAGAIRELHKVTRVARAALASITAPTLIMQSRLDNRVSGKVAEYAYKAIPASEKQLLFVERGGHILTVDYDRDIVTTKVREWFSSYMS